VTHKKPSLRIKLKGVKLPETFQHKVIISGLLLISQIKLADFSSQTDNLSGLPLIHINDRDDIILCTTRF